MNTHHNHTIHNIDTHNNDIIHDNINIHICIHDSNTIQIRMVHVDWRKSRNAERNEHFEGFVSCGHQVWARVIRSLARQRGEQPFACVVGLRQPLACTRFDCGDLGVPGLGTSTAGTSALPNAMNKQQLAFSF